MNKTKIIFAILGIILLWLIILLVTNLSNSNERRPVSSAWDLTLWTLYDDEGSFKDIVNDFKTKYPQYNSKKIEVESFWDYYTYERALSNALISESAPDIFALLNTQSSPLENAVSVISPSKISPNDFRVNYKPIFSQDLIISDPENPSSEYVVWVPFWYETLGVLYNRRYFTRPSELEDWSSVITSMKEITQRSWTIVPLAVGNASWVSRYASIIMSFLWLEGAESLKAANNNQIKQVFSFYKAFFENSGDNRYSILSAPLTGKTDIDFFTEGDVAAMIWFPRDIQEIDKIGYQSNFLYAAPFPKYAGSEVVQSVEYRYFVANNNSPHGIFVEDFLTYLASQDGQEKIIETFPYYLPAHLSVEERVLEQKIYPDYNIVYKNFIHPDARNISFDTWDLHQFETSLWTVLEMDSGLERSFSQTQKYILCSSNKANSLLNLSSSCK